MRYLSVCSGIEAASVAWRPLGWRAVAFSEIESFPCAVLAHHYPETPNWGDITRFEDWPNADVDVLAGGTPCQSFSVAGLRKGLDDPRGNLMLTYLAIAARYRPRWLVWENVPGVLSSNGGRDFGAFLRGLVELGYGFAYRVLDAQYFGVAQRRRRVFVVGCLGDWRGAAAVLLEPESLRGDSAPRRETGEGTAHPVASSLGASGRGFERAGETRGQDPVVAVSPTLRTGGNNTGGDRPPGTDVDTAESLQIVARSVAIRGRDGTPQAELGDDKANAILTPNGGRGGIGVGAVLAPSVSPALKARDYKGPSSDGDGDGAPLIAHALRGEGFDASEDGTGRGTLIVPAVAGTMKACANSGGWTNSADHAAAGYMVPVAFGWQNSSSQGDSSSETISPTLDKSKTPAVAFAENSRAELRLEGGDGQRTGTLSSGGGKPGQGIPMVFQDSEYGVKGYQTAGSLRAGRIPEHQMTIGSGMSVRRLTPRECERLQGFPDDYTLIPYRGRPAADGPRYKALGNSWAVPVAAWIGRRIALYEEVRAELEAACAS